MNRSNAANSDLQGPQPAPLLTHFMQNDPGAQLAEELGAGVPSIPINARSIGAILIPFGKSPQPIEFTEFYTYWIAKTVTTFPEEGKTCPLV